MNIFFRVVLAVYAFFLTIFSFLMIVLTFRPVFLEKISEYLLKEVLPNRNASIILLIIELAFFVISLVFLFSGFRVKKERKAVTRFTNIGEIKISLNTIESISLSATKKMSGVKECKAQVWKNGEGVIIAIKTVVLTDINIPTLLEDIQVKVKKSVEDSTGVVVNEVRALVDNVYSGYKSRVE